MPWKRVEIKKIPAPSKADIAYIAQWVWWTFAVIVLFGALGWNIFRPKTIIQTIVPKTEEFQTRKGNIGPQSYRAAIQEHTYDDKGKIFPHMHECKNFLVIDIKQPLKDEAFIEKIESISGVTRVRKTQYRIIIDRPCLPENSSLWTWEEIWKRTELVLKNHYGK